MVVQRPFQVRDLAKSDIDIVAEIHLQQTMGQLRTLMDKLYKRNPQQWQRTGKPSAQFVIERVFRGTRVPAFVELGQTRGTTSIRLAFRPDYEGDRVLAFVAGLTSMIQLAFNDQREFFLVDELDPQKIYNSARNIEIAAWQLGTMRQSNGQLFLLSNSTDDEPRNLSFERLFGNLIAQQDVLALILAERSNRTLRKVIQRLAGAVFLPI